MRVGICGYPGSGKSTIFRALAPGAGGDREIAYGSIKVPDERVEYLSTLFHTKKKTLAEITFVDVGAGGAKSGGAFPPEVIQAMRNVDALVDVVRGFENPMVAAAPDPVRDERAFDDELLLMDLGLLEKRVERMTKERKTGPELEMSKKCLAHLEKGEPLRTMGLTEDDRKNLGQGVQLLSMTPLITLYNLSEQAWNDAANAKLKEVQVDATSAHLALCGAIEADIAAMPEAEQKDFLEALGLGEPARNVFIKTAYRMLDYISFLTAGEDECRAWNIRRGTVARKAAGKVHSDIERGFIRAEIYRPEDLKALGTEAALKSAGKLRVEGKDYVMQDGDVVNFRFNV